MSVGDDHVARFLANHVHGRDDEITRYAGEHRGVYHPEPLGSEYAETAVENSHFIVFVAPILFVQQA